MNILITGASSGIGFQAALKLLSLKHNLIMPCRDEETSKRIFSQIKSLGLSSEENNNLYLPIIDLADIYSIKESTSDLLKRGEHIDTIALNAGLQYTGSKKPIWSKQGIELTFAVNHLSQQYLLTRLLPLLKNSKNPRVVITSSEVHNPKTSGGRVGALASLGELSGLKSGRGFLMLDGSRDFSADKAYKDSKLCNILFGKELSKRLTNSINNLSILVWAPGLVIPYSRDGFFRYSRKYNELGQRIFAFIARDLLHISETTINAGSILSKLCINSTYKNKSFLYLSNNLKYPGKMSFDIGKISDEASNDYLGTDLWESCTSLLNEINSN